MPLDLDNPQFLRGGTDFSAIEQFIQKEILEKDPKAEYPLSVIVVTDGQSQWKKSQFKPTTKVEKSWHWLLTAEPTRRSNSPAWSFGKHHSLEQFVEGKQEK
jgi:hypothetical protein